MKKTNYKGAKAFKNLAIVGERTKLVLTNIHNKL